MGIIASKAASAETLVEQVVDTRLVLAFRVDPAELQKLVPGPWDSADTATGPAKGANFNIIFYDRMLQQDSAGASMGPPYRFVVFSSVMKPKDASAAASVVSRIYASDPKRVPGPYKNSLLSAIDRQSVIESASNETSQELLSHFPTSTLATNLYSISDRSGYAAANSSRFVRLRFPATPAACSSMSRNGRRLRFPMIFELPLHARTEQRSSSADEFQDVKPRIVVRAVYNSIAVHEYVGRLNNARTVGPMIDKSRWLRWY